MKTELDWLSKLSICGCLVFMTACGSGNAASPTETVLTLPGNDVFGAIKEATDALMASADTEWDKVDLEALRQHLLDMKHVTEEVSILSKADIDKGVVIKIKAQPESLASLERVMSAHPAQLFSDKGWQMTVKQQADEFTLTVTTEKAEDVAKIRGLGYGGVLTIGGHHAVHHWALASGKALRAHLLPNN